MGAPPGRASLTTPTGDGTTILRGHPSHAKVQPPAGQRKYLHFSVILRPWVLVRPREWNPRPPALQSSALPTELILPRSKSSRFSKQNNNSARAPRFFEISLPSLRDYDLTWPNCKLFWGRERQGDIFYPAVWTLPSPLSSVPTKVSFILVTERLRIIAKWLKRMRSLSFNELLMDVAVVGS